MMNRVQSRSAHAPKALRMAILLAGCALAGYWWLTYSGLYRLLAELQLGWWRKYYPTYTGLFVVLLCLLPGAILVQVIGAIREKERGPEEAAAVAANDAARRARVQFWLEHRRGRLVGIGLTLALAGIGVYFLASGLLAGDRVAVDAGALERGERPAGRYVELTGLPLADDAVSVSEGRSHSEKVYVPVVSPEWRGDQPVRVYLAARPYALALIDGSERYEGILTGNSLPGLVISALAARGHPAPDRYWVLEFRETPKKQRQVGTSMLGVAGIIGLLTAIAWMIAARRERAATRPSP